jgi:hypothetical protein
MDNWKYVCLNVWRGLRRRAGVRDRASYTAHLSHQMCAKQKHMIEMSYDLTSLMSTDAWTAELDACGV